MEISRVVLAGNTILAWASRKFQCLYWQLGQVGEAVTSA